MKFSITLTHANSNEKIDFTISQIFYRHFSQAQKATIVVSVGGAFCPVKESREEISSLIEQALNNSPNGGAQ